MLKKFIIFSVISGVAAIHLVDFKTIKEKSAEIVKAAANNETIEDVLPSLKGYVKSSMAREEPMVSLDGEFLMYDLEFYRLYLRCSDRTASILWREERLDTANFNRFSNFYINPSIPRECQPLSTGTYKYPNEGGTSFDRGHIQNSNAFDYSREALYASNFMINVAPQVSVTNRNGSWRGIEVTLECMRTPKYINDDSKFTTIAGLVWGDHTEDDFFIKSHGQKTPSYFFKIAVFESSAGSNVYAWMVPNYRQETDEERASLDNHLVSVSDIVRMTGYTVLQDMVPPEWYDKTKVASPKIEPGCDRT